MRSWKTWILLGCLWVALLDVSPAARAQEGSRPLILPESLESGQAESEPIGPGLRLPAGQTSSRRIPLIEFRGVTLHEAMRAFSEQTGINVICTPDAGETELNVYLRDVEPMAALDSITRANGLFYREDDTSGIIRVSTTEEYERDLSSFREEQTEVFTLLYPNPVAVAFAIQNLFGQRVQMNFSDADTLDMIDLAQRFGRFDMVDGRALGLGTFQGNSFGASGSGTGGFGGNGLSGGFGGRFGNQGLGFGGVGGMNGLGGGGFGLGFNSLGVGNLQGGLNNRSRTQGRMTTADQLAEFEAMNDLTADQIQQLESMLAGQGGVDGDTRADLLERRQATIFVTVIRRNNQLIVRTGDERTMQQIAELIASLDVPTPLVLLEVKVMRITLEDGFESAFDYQFSDGHRGAGGFNDGGILPPTSNANNDASTRVAQSIDLGGTGLNAGALAFQYVNASFRARMQLLETDNRVTVLASPILLTANNEVSRIFVGDTLPFTVGFTAPQIVAAGTTSNTIAGTPITELRDVGQSLLITPNINADRTVTLRIVEENSRRVVDGANIPVPNATGAIVDQAVDTVTRNTVSGTIVAQDGLAVALGGLIEEEVSDGRQQVPVLGKLPGVGFFFRRQNTQRSRSELIVVVRPLVFTTPLESAASSADLLSELSIHPNAPDGLGSLHTFAPDEVVRPDPCVNLQHDMFRFHSVQPKRY